MPRGKSFARYIDEQTESDVQLKVELEEAFETTRVAVALARFREERGMSQHALARASGVLQPMISRIESGDQSPSLATLGKLMTALQASFTLYPGGEATLQALHPVQIEPARLHRT